MPLIANGVATNVRLLTADDLDIGVAAAARVSHASSSPDTPLLGADDPFIANVARLADEYGGVIFSGPPGTSKTYFAAEAARILTKGDRGRSKFVQFHASYQYEDFVLGFEPQNSGGFKFKDGPFLSILDAADQHRQDTYVLVIDELSRADAGRVFGEALTYVERSKRELPFIIASGREIKVPSNLIILATMNPFDRGVDEVDAAFERRFAKITMDPKRDLLESILTDNGVEEGLIRRIVGWFLKINGLAKTNPGAAVGHAYFVRVTDEASLRDLWDYQLRYLVERAFRREPNTQTEVETAWEHIFLNATPQGAASIGSEQVSDSDPVTGV